jgi:hypothetical protein
VADCIGGQRFRAEGENPCREGGEARRGGAEAFRTSDSEVRPSERRRREAYFSSTRVPRIFCEVIEFRKDGSSRSISSKNDDSAGVCVF